MNCACAILSSVVCVAVPYFAHYFINYTIFEKKTIEIKICVLIFSTILFETFHIIRKLERYTGCV
jgi:hypothetical protein